MHAIKALYIRAIRPNHGGKSEGLMRWMIAVVLMLAGPVAADTWQEPARGTPTRAELMDALRPHAEWVLGAPEQFVVLELRVAGDQAFAMLSAQRPGGAAIDLVRTPGAQRGEVEPDYMDGPTLQALYQRSGDTWVAVHHAIGATDAWFTAPPFCAAFYPVMSDFCAR